MTISSNTENPISKAQQNVQLRSACANKFLKPNLETLRILPL